MTAMFTGWMGYGTIVPGNVLMEPSDPGYVRHAFALGPPDGGMVVNAVGGTSGPATTGWGTLGHAGVFDAEQGGNLLFWMPLETPVTVPGGATITVAANSQRFAFPDLHPSGATARFWSAGSVIATVGTLRRATAGVALQFADGRLSALAPVLGSSVTMASLPSVAPTTGSGQLWNNGGIVTIA